MNNHFSNNFKELRKLQDLTQEQVAEMLGVTSQAISKWECGTSYPDIEMLPIIANHFKVSTDYLLGVDITAQEKEIAETIQTAKDLRDKNRYEESVILLRNALIQYPSSCDMMYWLAWSLRGTIKDYPEREQEAINIYRRILNISKNSELLCRVTRDLAYCYYTLGDLQTSRTYLEHLPSFEVCREYHFGRSNVLNGKELSDLLQDNIQLYAKAIEECLEYFVNENILKESEMLPYSIEKAKNHLEIIREFIK